jgi:hypothetical protein
LDLLGFPTQIQHNSKHTRSIRLLGRVVPPTAVDHVRLRRGSGAYSPEYPHNHDLRRKRIMRKLVSLMIVLMMMTGVTALAADLPAADVAEQGFNAYDKAVGYNDI